MDSWQSGIETSEARHLRRRRASWGEHNWGWVLALGVGAVVLGLLLLSNAFGGLSVLVWLTGLFLLLMGGTEILAATRSGARGARATGGLIAIAGGIILLAWPGETVKVLAVLAGVTFIGWGLVTVLAALRSRREGRSPVSGLAIGSGLIVLGIVVLAWPAATVTIVGILVGLVAIAWGAVTVLGALDLRRAGHQLEEERRGEREESQRRDREERERETELEAGEDAKAA